MKVELKQELKAGGTKTVSLKMLSENRDDQRLLYELGFLGIRAENLLDAEIFSPVMWVLACQPIQGSRILQMSGRNLTPTKFRSNVPVARKPNSRVPRFVYRE